MKKTYKIVLIFYFLFLNVIAFAQDNPSSQDDTGTDNLEGGDAVDVSISDNLWLLIVIGLLYSFILINRNFQMKKLK